MYPSNCWNFLLLVCTPTWGTPKMNKPKTYKMVATGGQIKLTIDDI